MLETRVSTKYSFAAEGTLIMSTNISTKRRGAPNFQKFVPKNKQMLSILRKMKTYVQ